MKKKHYILCLNTPYGVLGFYGEKLEDCANTDSDFLFEIVDNDEMTEKLLDNCSFKTIKIKNVSQAIKDIKEVLQQIFDNEIDEFFKV